MSPRTRGPARRLPREVVAALDGGKILKIRAGARRHRFIGIGVVVVERRIFVRSWSLEPRSWWRTFLEDPRGAIRVGGRTIAVRAVQIRSGRLRDAVDRAYLAKYGTGGSRRYALDLAAADSRATTTELVPL